MKSLKDELSKIPKHFWETKIVLRNGSQIHISTNPHQGLESKFHTPMNKCKPQENQPLHTQQKDQDTEEDKK